MKSEKAYSSILLPVMSMSRCLGKGKNKASLCIRKSLSEYSFISSCCHWRAVLDFSCLLLVSCNQPLSCMQPARDSLGRSSLGTLLLVMLKCTFSLFRIWLVLFFFGTMLWKGVSNPSLIQQPISGWSCHDFVNLDHFPPSPGYFWNRRVLTCLFVPYCRTHSYVFVLYELIWNCSILIQPLLELRSPELIVVVKMGSVLFCTHFVHSNS